VRPSSLALVVVMVSGCPPSASRPPPAPELKVLGYRFEAGPSWTARVDRPDPRAEVLELEPASPGPLLLCRISVLASPPADDIFVKQAVREYHAVNQRAFNVQTPLGECQGAAFEAGEGFVSAGPPVTVWACAFGERLPYLAFLTAERHPSDAGPREPACLDVLRRATFAP
jgi:hypothetical protein